MGKECALHCNPYANRVLTELRDLKPTQLNTNAAEQAHRGMNRHNRLFRCELS